MSDDAPRTFAAEKALRIEARNERKAAERKPPKASLSSPKSVAAELLAVQQRYEALASYQKAEVRTFFHELQSISEHLAVAAKHGAMIASNLNLIAYERLIAMADEDRTDKEELATIARLVSVSNEAAKTGLALLHANREAVRERAEDDDRASSQIGRIERALVRCAN